MRPLLFVSGPLAKNSKMQYATPMRHHSQCRMPLPLYPRKTLAMKKNVLLLHTHDTGRCIQPYGYAVETPHLAAFARQGALFRQAFDCGPTCSPARAALLTGQVPHECGMLGLAHRGFGLNDPGKHLANYLRGNGYRTVLAGIQHETNDKPATLGYEENIRRQRIRL